MSTTTSAPSRTRHENPVLGDAATILESADAGGRTLIEVEVAPGGGTAPHIHCGFDEHFRALEGVVTVEVNGQRRVLCPGDEAVAPAGSVHRFRNESDETITFHVELRPGHAGFEEALAIAYGLARDGRVYPDGTPRNILEVAVLVELAGTAAAGPMKAVERPLLGLARYARRRGVLARLRRQYV